MAATTTVRRGRSPRNPCECGTGTKSVLQDHAFEPGQRKRHLCFQFGCQRGGYHVACARCDWPADEHPKNA